MGVAGAIFLSVGTQVVGSGDHRVPDAGLAGSVVGMTAPMVAWMQYRGMGRRDSYEMAAAMVLPVIPFLCLV